MKPAQEPGSRAPSRSAGSRTALRSGLPILALAAFACGAAWFVLHGVSLDAFLTWAIAAKRHATANQLPALAIFGFTVFALAACAIPIGSIVTATGGFLFGGLLAGTIATGCATLGGAVLFSGVRMVASARRGPPASPRLARLLEGFRTDAASYLLFLRLTPTPFVLVNVATAMARVRLSTFVWTTLVGILPVTLTHAFAGAAIGTGAAAQRRAYDACMASRAPACSLPSNLAALGDPSTVVALAAVGLLALLPILLRKLLTRRTERHDRPVRK